MPPMTTKLLEGERALVTGCGGGIGRGIAKALKAEGATVLGSGLGRDSAIATEGERASGRGWLAFVERSFEAYRAYYEYLPQGTTSIEYTLRLNNVGQFAQPATRVEALYAPEVFGVAPNAAVKVEAR